LFAVPKAVASLKIRIDDWAKAKAKAARKVKVKAKRVAATYHSPAFE
jgi:hypothetical protein